MKEDIDAKALCIFGKILVGEYENTVRTMYNRISGDFLGTGKTFKNHIADMDETEKFLFITKLAIESFAHNFFAAIHDSRLAKNPIEIYINVENEAVCLNEISENGLFYDLWDWLEEYSREELATAALLPHL